MLHLRRSSFRWPATAILVGGLLVASALPAYAADDTNLATADQADVEFRLGTEAYRARQYEKALSHFFASNRLVPNRNVLFNIARCYENLASYVEAFRYYGTLLETSLEATEQKELTQAIARVDKFVSILRIESEPPGATVFLNRRDLGSYGVTPLDLPVKPDEYKIILEKDGWESKELAPITLKPGETTAQKATLIRTEAAVSLSGTPPTVFIQVENEPSQTDTDPVALPGKLKIPVNKQTLIVSAPGFEPVRIPVDAHQNSTIDIEIALVPQTGTLVITSSELNSTVRLDGQLAGFTPVVLSNIPASTHRISIGQEGFEPYTKTFELSPDERIEVHADLEPLSEIAAASRVAEALRDAPASVSLISAREIDAFGYTGTADAIQGVRGFFYTNDMTYRLIGVRGYGPFGAYGNRVQVQLDGHTLNESWVEASYHQFEVMTDLYGLDRIELVRGPSSLLYGSGAFQGVINLVSPELGGEQRRSRAGITAVSDGVLRAYGHLQHAFGSDKDNSSDGGLQLSAAVAGGQGRDYFSAARFGSPEYPTGIADDVGGFDAYTLRANSRWKNFTLYSYFHSRDQQSPVGAYDVIFGDPRARERDQRGYVDLRYDDSRDAPLTFHGRAYYDYYGFKGTFPYEATDGGLLTDTFKGHWGGAEGRVVYRPFEGARWTAGAELVRHFVNQSENTSEINGLVSENSTPFWKTSAHAILRHDFGQRFSILAGGRYDLWYFDSLPTVTQPGGAPPGNNQTESHQIGAVSPRLVIMGRPVESGTLKLMGGTGFRAPSVYELTYNDGGLTQVAAPDLLPENIYSGELEYTQELPAGIEAVGAIFANQLATRIEQSGAGTSADPLKFVNIDEPLWSTGAEIELRRPFLRGWMASAQYSFQHTRTGDFENLWNNSPALPNSPVHLAALKLVAPISYPAIQLANRLIYEAPRLDRNGDKTGPTFLWDVTFSGQLATLPIRYAAGVRNLLDWRHEHPVGDQILDTRLPQPGRSFVVDISAEF